MQRFLSSTTLRPWLLLVLLLFYTAAVYYQAADHGFLIYDDPAYVSENEYVRQGLAWDGFKWAMTAFHAANWHPLTWLSHMLDVTLLGPEAAGAHHLMNVLLHLANTLLLFLLLRGMTRAPWPSLAVAALFALHPSHVESVAWISERKDLLSTFLMLCTLIAYVAYVRRKSLYTYLRVALLFAAGLMAKPMLVTLPFVLLLLDYWPLGRFADPPADPRRPADLRRRAPWWLLLREKVPLLALSTASCVVTFIAQHSGHAVSSLDTIPVLYRIANAVNAYGAYLLKLFWPEPLAVFYPLPAAYAWLPFFGALALLSAISVSAIHLARRRPYLAVGWAWYLGTLVPVIGLVQVGLQSMADRYTYIPSIGIFMALSWALAEAFQRIGQRGKLAAAVVGAICIAALGAKTWHQAGLWRDNVTLFAHTLAVTRQNPIAHELVGQAYMNAGRLDPAIRHLTIALGMRPDSATIHYRLGDALFRQRQMEAAANHFQEAIRLDPALTMAYNNLGNLYAGDKRFEEAADCYLHAIRLDPRYARAHFNLGTTLGILGRFPEAAHHLEIAAGLEPDNEKIRMRLSQTYYLLGDIESAAREREMLSQLDPSGEKELNQWLAEIESKKKIVTK
jgi:tetratricopeptide (TPR) repeat protein